MAFIEWDDSLSVGVEEIDQEHKKEVDLINALHDAQGDEQMTLLKELVEHTKKHFATEEKYFDKFGYEDSEAHKAEHKAFLDKAAQIGADVEQGKELTEDIFDAVKTWLIDHIKSMDQKYTSCFNEHGLT
jgi:hemerythrin-like metal-binding protein